jgi:ribosome maturation factor RimP
MDLQAIVESTLNGLGYELVDLEIANRGRLLRLFIDKPGGVTVEDCAFVSDHVTKLLAVELDYDYDRLEVSSPGLDRLLKKESDFRRFAGERAKIKLRMPLNGKRNFQGILRETGNGILKLEVDGALLSIELSNLEKARLIPNI